ncbi:serine/threonine protein kinase [Martiniozyma asiatica (nom. inval.)]|nr:serine/threonine protein kinase [Martiniozyma asiatica]
MSNRKFNGYSDFNRMPPPPAIGDYGDLYDDYLDSPRSPRSPSMNTMNSGAAVYDQSVDPSYENFQNGSNASLVTLDSLQNCNENQSQSQSQSQFCTPQMQNSSAFGTPIFSSSESRGINTIPIEYYQESPVEYVFNNDNDNDTSNNNNHNYDDDNDDDYNESETAYLIQHAQQRKANIYKSNMNPGLESPSWDSPAKIISNVQDVQENHLSKNTKKSIKDFKLGKELGEGSYSTVVLATDIENSKHYALKILNKKYIIKEDKVKYVKFEKDALNRLNNHHGIIRLHYTFQDLQNLYFVLDYAENGELLSLIKKFGTMDEESTKYYTMQLIDSIDYMHKNGIIHRDLKPENILINKYLKIQITDFGTAKLMDKNKDGLYPSDTRAKSFVGTAEYVSPELLNDKYCGKPADIWALGCVIYQMIAGRPPFKAQNEYQTFQKIQKLQYAFTAGFPIIIRDLIKRILIIKPKERLDIDEIKNHFWFKDDSWSQNFIWDRDAPNLKPFKMNAKLMKPIPELEKQYPFNKNKHLLKSQSSSVLTSVKNDLTVKKLTTGALKLDKSKSNSSPNVIASTSIPMDNKNGNSIVNKEIILIKNGSKKKVRSASNAAVVALYGSNVASSSKGQRQRQISTSSSTSSTSPAPGSGSNSGPILSRSRSNMMLQSSPLPMTGLTQSDVQQATADLIIKARQQRDKINSSRSPSTNLDVIPGTNIPRPVLNTKISSAKSSNNSKSRNNSSLTKMTPNNSNNNIKTSLLDKNWKLFLKLNEHVIKAGLVEVLKEKTISFEKKYKGCLAESPLGYRNQDTINMPNLFSVNEEKAINYLKEEEEETDDANEDDHKEDEDISVGGKFKKFFIKTPVNASAIDVKPQSRFLVITSQGRALFFKLISASDKLAAISNDKEISNYELTTEIDLTNSNIHFVEVIPNSRQKGNDGTFAIMSNISSLVVDVKRTDISSWTSTLAQSRMMEKEKRFLNFANSVSVSGNSSDDVKNDEILSESTAWTAAAIAASKSPGGFNENNKDISGASVSKLKSPKSNKNRNDSSPMIASAISKAVSMASVNAAVGKKESKKKITQMNSKFLARSRLK